LALRIAHNDVRLTVDLLSGEKYSAEIWLLVDYIRGQREKCPGSVRRGFYRQEWRIAVANLGSDPSQRLNPAHSPSGAYSARGISIATAKTSVNAGRHRRTYRQEPGHKGALAVRLRKLAIDGEKTLQWVAELAYQQSFQV